jgi:hypothetical protein
MHENCKNSQFPALIILKITENAVFYFKVLNKIYFNYKSPSACAFAVSQAIGRDDAVDPRWTIEGC